MFTIQRGRSNRPFFYSTNIISIANTSLFLILIMITSGCAHRLIDIKDMQKVQTYDELKYLADGISCNKLNSAIKCFYYYNSFNIFLLNHRNQEFNFTIDRHGEIIERTLKDTHTQYHILPQSELPNAFSEYK